MSRLLLIDTDPGLISQQIQQAFPPPHSLDVVSTAAEGIERARGSPPDVVLLDIVLPDRSGLEVCQLIRRINP